MKKGGLYLTIDDGPSERFGDFCDFLSARGIQAVFFNRGDAMAQRPDAVIRAIKQGFIIASHAYSHKRFSTLSLEEAREEIKRTEAVLDDLHERAGVRRAKRYFRFPYMDRGMGAALLEPETLPAAATPAYKKLVTKGLGHTLNSPDNGQRAYKDVLQNILREFGIVPLPCPGVTLPLYAQTEMATAFDSLCTFSTSDWALSARHKGKHGFSSLNDLKAQIDGDPDLQSAASNHIILAHDQAEIFDVITALIDHFLYSGFEFLDFSDQTE